MNERNLRLKSSLEGFPCRAFARCHNIIPLRHVGNETTARVLEGLVHLPDLSFDIERISLAAELRVDLLRQPSVPALNYHILVFG